MRSGSGPQSLVLPLVLHPRLVKRTIAWLALTATLMLAGTWLFSRFFRGISGSWADAHPIKHFLVHFSLGAENVIAAWFASMLLLLVATASMTAFTVDALTAPRRRILHAGWLVLALLFTVFSLDELGSIHERVSTITDSAGEVEIGWYASMILLGSIVVFMAAFGLLHVRRVRVSFLLMIAGILCYTSLPFQEHFEIQAYLAAGAGWQRPTGWLLVEEGTELAGSLCFLASALFHATATLADRRPDEKLLMLRLPLRLALLIVCALVALLGLGLVAAQLLFGGISGEDGIPRNWFPATLALVTGGLALWIGLTQGLRGYRAVAMMQLMASAFVGTNLYGWRFLAAPSMPLRFILAGALALAIGSAAVLLIQRTESGLIRLCVAAWGILLFWGMTSPHSHIVAPLIFSASAILLLVLLAQSAGAYEEEEGITTEIRHPRSMSGVPV